MGKRVRWKVPLHCDPACLFNILKFEIGLSHILIIKKGLKLVLKVHNSGRHNMFAARPLVPSGYAANDLGG